MSALPRRSATRLTSSLRSGFRSNAWGYEYLDVWINNGNPNDASSDINQVMVASFNRFGITMPASMAITLDQAVALIATVAGLCVAIPSLIAYRYLRGKVERIVVGIEKNAMRMADALEAAHAREHRLPGSPAVAVA